MIDTSEFYKIGGLPAKNSPSGWGDSLLWAGLVVSTCRDDEKYSWGINITKCQDNIGRIWRNPEYVGKDKENSCSRDMALGFILYLQRCPFYGTALSFIDYLKENNNRLCPDATDNRSYFTPAMWWCLHSVIKTQYSGITYRIPLIYSLTGFLYPLYLFIAAYTSPKGYQLHLLAVQTLIRTISRKRYSRIGRILARRCPFNPFFNSISNNVSDRDMSVDIFKSYLHSWNINKGESKSPYSEWLWERDYNNPNFSPSDSMGWDLVFMKNLHYQQYNDAGYMKDYK